MNAAQSGGHAGGVSKKSAQMEELVAISPERRNWRGIFIALLVIAAVFSLILFSIYLLSPDGEAFRLHGRRIILSDVIGKGLQFKSFNGTWNNDHELIYRDTTGGLSILNLENNTIRILMTNSTFRQLNVESFLVSPDQKYVLLRSDGNSEGSRYHIYDVQTANTFPLGSKENIAEAPRLQYVAWAPNFNDSLAAFENSSNSPATATATTTTINNGSSNGTGFGKPLTSHLNNNNNNNFSKIQSQSAIAFVYENDIYYKPKIEGELICRITATGQHGLIYNGIPDWTYSTVAELRSNSLVFSPNGMYIAFLTYNDKNVNEYRYSMTNDDAKYPTILTQRYPTPGSTNPNVTVNVVNLSVLKYIFPMQVQMPPGFSNNSYIGGLTWANSVDLSFTITNRPQTKAVTMICRAPHFRCQTLHTEVTVNDGWLLPAERPIFSKRSTVPLRGFEDNTPIGERTSLHNVTNGQTTYKISTGNYLLKRLPVRDGEHGYYRHVVLVSPADRAVPLTMGRFEVTEILGWDEANEIVYFMSAPEGRPSQRHLYKIGVKINIARTNQTYITSTQPTCLTCDNTAATFNLRNTEIKRKSSPDSNLPKNGNQTESEERCTHEVPKTCLYNKIYFSRDFSYYVQECLGPIPSIYLVDASSNIKIFALHTGESLRQRLSQLALPQIRSFNVEIRHGFHAQVRLFLPPGMHEDEEAAFPLILHVDAAPGSQLVSDKFQIDWNWYLCSYKNYIVAQIDGRGSGFQGEMLRTQIHGKLGTVEVEDQLGVLKYLRDNLKFIDPARICVYGWGYGGYTTIMSLIEDSQQMINCGIALNPIVSFNYHYSFFTERYIPLNGDYLRVLQQSDIIMKAGNLRGRNLMLIHGTADTFVHQEHSLMLVRALVDQGIIFRHQVYPDEDHNLQKSLSHVYKTMQWYLDEQFGTSEYNDWDPTTLLVLEH